MQGGDRRRAVARPQGRSLSGNPGDDPPPEADFGATIRYMALVLGGIAALALLIGWLLTR
jgi:hypothetical protein